MFMNYVGRVRAFLAVALLGLTIGQGCGSAPIPESPPTESSGTIGPDGGSVSLMFPDGTQALLNVPSGAVPNRTTATLRVVDSVPEIPSSSIVQVGANAMGLGFAGQPLSREVTVSVPLPSSGAPRLVCVLAYDSATSTWYVPAQVLAPDEKSIQTLVPTEGILILSTSEDAGMPKSKTIRRNTLPDPSTFQFGSGGDDFSIHNSISEFVGEAHLCADDGNGYCWGFSQYAGWYFSFHREYPLHDGYSPSTQKQIVHEAWCQIKDSEQGRQENLRLLAIAACPKGDILCWQTHSPQLDAVTIQAIRNQLSLGRPAVISLCRSEGRWDSDPQALHSILAYKDRSWEDGTGYFECYDSDSENNPIALSYSEQTGIAPYVSSYNYTWALVLYDYGNYDDILGQIYAKHNPASCGAELASYRGIPAQSNGSPEHFEDSCKGKGKYGDEYQCVEYVKRFYGAALGVDVAKWPTLGDAGAAGFYPRAREFGLQVFSNGSSSTAPEADDIIVFGPTSSNSYGHVAIVTSVAPDHLSIIEQNASRTGIAELVLTKQSGGWKVQDRGSYAVLGWLRPHANLGLVANDQSVSVAYQSPTSITLTASGSQHTLTYAVMSPPSHGTLAGTPPSLTYTPASGYSGPDSFTFYADDGVACSLPATVSITILTPATVATPTFNPPNSTSFADSLDVAISTTTDGAAIRYTLDGSTPTSSSGTIYVSGTPVLLTATTTLQAIACKTGMTDSTVASATFTKSTPGTVATPTFSPDGATFTTSQGVIISCATAGATIRYTTNGTTPSQTNGAIITSGASTNLTSTTTLKAIGYMNGMVDSDIASALFTKNQTGAVVIETVTVGNPGNAADTRYNGISVGSVAYTYQMGKYDVTAGQYCVFLNAVAKTDTYGLYTPSMDTADNFYGCNIKRSGASGSYSYSVASDWANRPVNWVSWGDAARFANWLANGQPTGAQSPPTTEDGSYALNGAMSNAALLAVTRKPNATWVIPSEDEWYKAAYYDPSKPGGAGYWDYPTRSNEAPTNVFSSSGTNNANYYSGRYVIGAPYYRTEVGAFAGSPSAYGTYDQGGNVWQMNEAVLYGTIRGLRGGSFWGYGYSDYALKLHASLRDWGSNYPITEKLYIGFRVSQVP